MMGIFGNLRWGFDRKIWMSCDEGLETWVCFEVGYFPWKPTEDHAQENDGNAPYICFTRVVRIVVEDFWSEVRIATNYAGSRGVGFARVMEDGSCTKVDEFDDVFGTHDNVVKFEIAVC